VANEQALFNESLNKGHSFLFDQQWKAAIEAFETAVTITKDEPAPYAGLGDAYMGLEQLQKALENYKLAARYSRGSAIYLRKVAQVQEDLGQPREAGKTYMALGEMALSRRQLDEAMSNWHSAVRLEPNLLRAHQRLASIYQRQGAVRNAIQEYLTIAHILQNQGANAQALETCKMALQLDPRNPEILTAIEMVKQGKRIFKSSSPTPTKQTGVTGMLRQMAISSEDDWDPSKQDAETAAPVQDARRLAMEELAGGLFDEDGEEDIDKLQRGFIISQALDNQRRGLVNEAISNYEKAIAAGEDSMAAHFNLGLLYQDKLRFEDAIKEFEYSVTQREYKLASHFALGECYRGRGRIEQAIEHFISVLKIVDLADRLIELYENLADGLATQGEHDQATAFANALVEFLSHKGWEDKVQQARQRLDSISDAGMMILGDVLTAGSEQVLESLYLSQEYTKRGMYNTAVEEIYRAIQLSYDYLPAHIQLGEVLAQQGRRDVAAQKFITVADTFKIRGDINSAVAAYERVVELSPLDLIIRSKLIDLLKRHGQIDQSLEHYLAMGDAYYQLAQVDKAREAYQEALKLTSRASDASWRPQFLRLIADIDMQRLDWKRALATYKELRQLEPEDERTAITLVDLHYRVGQNTEAVQSLDKYLIHLVRNGRGAKVIGILEDMVEQRPADGNLVDRLSRLYIQQKRMGAAITLLDKLGEAQLEAGQAQQAVNTIEKILKLNPPNADSYQQLLSQLKRQANN
jgi:tetratricopeptide (TPR) repeat protein